MVQSVGADAEKKVMAILRVLSESSEPLGSITIARELERYGVTLSERGVRHHLRITDERGYTQLMGRDGRLLTLLGREEIRSAMAPGQVGFVLDKLEMLSFLTTFDPATRIGMLPINTSLMAVEKFPEAISVMREVYDAGFCVSDLAATASEGEKLGSVVVPAGKVGLATVCSVAVNGVLLKAGIPVGSKFGGVLEVRNNTPRRFVAIINYSGTSIDPSEQYIRAGMTSVRTTVKSGSGKILANFREMPAPARQLVEEKTAMLREAGITGVYVLGHISEPVCQIPMGLNRVGMVLLGGLNPIAAVAEAGIEVENIAESGVLDYAQLTPFNSLFPA